MTTKPKTRQGKVYLVLSERNNHLFGAFPFSDEGFKQAEAYAQKITKKNKEKYFVKIS
jgi:hypothetical protein